jgi:hypothetical protein
MMTPMISTVRPFRDLFDPPVEPHLPKPRQLIAQFCRRDPRFRCRPPRGSAHAAGLRPGVPRSRDRSAQRRPAPTTNREHAGPGRRAGRADARGRSRRTPDRRRGPREADGPAQRNTDRRPPALPGGDPEHRPPPGRLRPPRTSPGTAARTATPRPATTARAAAPDPALSPRGSTLRGKGLRIVADAVRPAPDRPATGRSRAFLGKLIGKIEERRPR